MEVGCDERGLGHQLGADDSDHIPLEERIARSCHHYRVENVVAKLVVADGGGNYGGDGGGAQHAGFCRRRGKVLNHRIYLGAHQIGRNGFPLADPARVLRSNGSDRRRPEHAKPLKCFQVGLNSGAAARIRTGNGERYAQSTGPVAEAERAAMTGCAT